MSKAKWFVVRKPIQCMIAKSTNQIKIPQQGFALQMQKGGLMHEGGGAYLCDTTVHGNMRTKMEIG